MFACFIICGVYLIGGSLKGDALVKVPAHRNLRQDPNAASEEQWLSNHKWSESLVELIGFQKNHNLTLSYFLCKHCQEKQ
jgi:hypothetical protein